MEALAVALCLLLGGSVYSNNALHSAQVQAEIALKQEWKAKSAVVRFEQYGLFGGFFGQLKLFDITTDGVETDSLPLTANSGLHMTGAIDEVRIVLNDSVINGIAFEEIIIWLPDVKYNISKIDGNNSLKYISSGEGLCVVTVSLSALLDTVKRKYRNIQEIKVTLSEHRVVIDGYVRLFGFLNRCTVWGRLGSSNRRMLEIEPVAVFINDELVANKPAELLLSAINPIINLDTDLQLNGAADILFVSVNETQIVVVCAVRLTDSGREEGEQ